MGGDYAPDATIEGAIIANQKLQEHEEIVMFGPEDVIREKLVELDVDPNTFLIVHAPEVISMHDNPTKAFARKKKSSIYLAYEMLNEGGIDGFASAGSTGAMMVGAMSTIKPISGIVRPAIAGFLPTLSGKSNLLLDVGLNADCKPDVLYQYGVLGSIYCSRIYKVENPRVALVNIGMEEGKGNLVSRSAYDLMKDSLDFNFVGNVEGNELYRDDIDVIVTDGFVGNVLLKQAESFYTLLKNRGIKDKYFDHFDFERFGGVPILGVNGNVIIGHGISTPLAISNMILQTKDMIDAKLALRINEFFNYE